MSLDPFARALAVTLEHEGGFANHPADPGGATYRGITLATLSRARGRPASVADLRALTDGEIAEIYRRFYWRPAGCDALPPGLDLAVFDLAVHSGPGRALELLRRAKAAAPSAASTAKPAALVGALCAERLAFLRRLPGHAVFGRGWERRVLAVERQARAMAATPSPTGAKTPMIPSKSIFASRTLWSNAIGLVALALSAFGFDGEAVPAEALADAALQLVTAGAFVASTLFRVFARTTLAT